MLFFPFSYSIDSTVLEIAHQWLPKISLLIHQWLPFLLKSFIFLVTQGTLVHFPNNRVVGAHGLEQNETACPLAGASYFLIYFVPALLQDMLTAMPLPHSNPTHSCVLYRTDICVSYTGSSRALLYTTFHALLPPHALFSLHFSVC